MKKLLIAFTLLFFAGFCHAATLQGKIFDGIKNEDISGLGVLVTLGNENSANSTISNDEDDGYFFDNFAFYEGDALNFTKKDEYLPIDGSFSCNLCSENSCPTDCNQFVYTYDNGVETNEIVFDVDLDNPDATYQLDVKMYPVPQPVISGTIYYEDEYGDALPVDSDDVELKVYNNGNFAGFSKIELLDYDEDHEENKGKFKVLGYFDKDGKEIEYEITVNYPGYEEVVEEIKVKDDAIQNAEIVLDERTATSSREKNLEAITGFKCNELMPKYLVGANCVENSTLDGDATDLALWIQKFGGKITSMISMIAVVLIVWNAFSIVTAAGDEEKISKGKKGIMWTILGLALTMFAYVIVKTVILLTYTQ